jgi:hypothetical protein
MWGRKRRRDLFGMIKNWKDRKLGLPRLFFPSPHILINLDILYTTVLCQCSSLYVLKSITKVALDPSSLALSVEE